MKEITFRLSRTLFFLCYYLVTENDSFNRYKWYQEKTFV